MVNNHTRITEPVRRQSSFKRPLLLVSFVLLLVVAVLLNVLMNRRATTADPTNAPLVALGKQVYAANCASCHGANLEGQPNWQQDLPDGGRPAPPHDASGHTWHHNDQSLFTTVKYGG